MLALALIAASPAALLPAASPAPAAAAAVHLATGLGDDTQAIVLSPAEAEARALLDALPAAITPPADYWDASQHTLPVSALDGVTQGSRWTLANHRERTTCTVTGFQVHLGFGADPAELTLSGGEAPCSTPLFVATVRCDSDIAWSSIALPAESEAVIGVRIDDSIAPPSVFDRHAVVKAVHDQTLTESAEYSAGPVHRETTASRFSVGERTVDVVTGRHFTGEGFDGCGDPDIVRQWSGLVVDGVPQTPRKSSEHTVMVLDLEGDGVMETLTQDFTLQTLRRADGTVIVTSNVGWCECPC